MSSTNEKRRIKHIQSLLDENSSKTKKEAANDRTQDILNLLYKNGYSEDQARRMRENLASDKARLQSKAVNNGSVVRTPSAMLGKSDAVNTEGVSQALERDKKLTSKTKKAPEGIRFNKNKTGFDVEQVKERKKELDNFEDVKIEGVSDEMNRSLVNLMQQYNEAKKITSVTERDNAVNKLLQDNKTLLHEYAKSTGYPINTPDINKLNSIERILRQERKDNYISDTYNKRMGRHFDVVHNSDFAQYSGVDEKKADNYLADKVNYTFKNAFDEHGKTKRQGGLPYVPSNGTEVVRDSQGNRVEEGKVIYAINDDDVKWLYMNSDERKIYNYYLNKYGKEQATKFLDDLKLVLDKRYVEAKEAVKTESIAKLKDKNKALGVTVGAADDLVNGLFKLTGEAYGDVISQAIDQYTGTAETIRPYNPYTSATLPTHEARISREAIEDGMSETGKKVTDFALSLGENIERLPAGPVGLYGMAVSVAGDTAVNRGLNGETSAGRAAATGAAYGAAEYLTEKLPLENVLNLMEAPPKTVREWFMQLFKNGLTEFGEEAISNIADNAADEFINGNKSEFAQAVRDYQENGLSIQQATQKAFVDKYIIDTLKSAGSGFLSGVSLAGLGAGVGKLVEGADNRTVNKYKKGAQISIEKANKAVTEAANKAGIENVGLPSAPNWKSASIEEVDNYVNETVKKYNELLNDEKVTGENKEAIKQAINGLGIVTDGQPSTESKSTTQDIEQEANTQAVDETTLSDSVKPSAQSDESINNNGIKANGKTINQDTLQSITSRLTQSVLDIMNSDKGAGAPSDATRLMETNMKIQSAADVLFDKDFVSAYAEVFSQGMAERNSNAYKNLSQSTDNISSELASYVLTGHSDLRTNTYFTQTADRFKTVLADAIGKNTRLHNNLYGNSNILNEQANAVVNGDFSVLNVNKYGFTEVADEYKIPGLLQDEYSDFLTSEERNALESIGKAISVPIKIIDSIKLNNANGCYHNGVIYIALDAQDKAMVVFSHEVTHYLENVPSYATYRDIVLDIMSRQEGKDVQELINEKIASYTQSGIELTAEDALHEIVADYTRNILSNPQESTKFVNSIENVEQRRGVIRSIIESIKSLINKLRSAFKKTPQSVKDLQATQGIFENMLKEAANGEFTEGNSTQETMFSPIEYDADGRAYVHIEEDILKGVPENEWIKTVKNVLREKFADGIGYKGKTIAVSGKSRSEFTNSDYTHKLSNGEKADKYRMANNLDEIINTQDNVRNENPNHARTDDIISFDRGDITVEIGNRAFDAEILIANKQDGTQQFYDIVNLVQTTIQHQSQTGRVSANTVDGDNSAVSTFSISKNNEIVNRSFEKEDAENKPQFSLKQPIEQTKTDSFKNWFGDWENDPDNASKVVNEDGTPKIMYHGTLANGLHEFKKEFIGSRYSYDDTGFFFISRKSIADDYATSEFDSNKRGEVISAYLDVKKPFIFDSQYARNNGYGNIFKNNDVINIWDTYQSAILDELEDGEYDGIIIDDGTDQMAVVFEPTQIKSATDNIGTFDPNNADIWFSQSNGDTKYQSAYRAAQEFIKENNLRGMVYQRDVKEDIQYLTDMARKVFSEESDVEAEYPKLRAKAQEMAEKITDNRVIEEDAGDTARQIRKDIKATHLKITDELRKGIPDFNSFMRSNLGNVTLSNNGVPIDVQYQEWATQYPGYFDTEENVNIVDQLYDIVNVSESLKNHSRPLTNYEYYESVEDLTNQILAKILNVGEAKAKTIKAESEYDNEDWGDLMHGDEAWRQQQLQHAEEKKQRNVERMRYEKKLQQFKDKVQAEKQRAKEQRQESELMTQLLKSARKVQNGKWSEAEKSKFPDLVWGLDTFAKSLREHGYTRADGIVVNGRIELEKLLQERNEAMENNPDYIPDAQLDKRVARVNRKQIGDMDIGDIRALYEAVQIALHDIQTARKLLNDERNRDIAQVAGESAREIDSSKGLSDKWLTGAKSYIELYWNKQLNPEQFFKRMVGFKKDSAFVGLGKALDDGQTKSLQFKQKSSSRFNNLVEQKENMKRFTGRDAELIDISKYDSEGRRLLITPEMRVSLYLQSKNYANLRHIKYGGITLPNMYLYRQGNYVEAYKRGAILRLTPSQITEITNGMTDFEKRFADAAYQFFNDDCKKAVNDTSLVLNGYEIATVKDYFPIVANKDFVVGNFESLVHDGTLEGKGFLDDRKNANNPIALEAVTKVIVRHSNDVADYYGLAIPIRNFNRVYNAIGKNYSYSIKQALSSKWSSNEKEYIENLMVDLQGGRQDKSKGAQAIARLNSNYANAVLTLNLGVALQQSGSYPTAAAVVGYKSLAKAFTENVTDEDKRIIHEHTPYLYIREQGYATREIGDYVNGTSDDWTKKGKMPALMGLIQKVDIDTTTRLWKAAEFYVRDNFKAMERGSKAYYDKVTEVYNEVIKRTQPNYTVMQRSDLLRDPNGIIKTTTMFRTQPSQNHNLVYDAVGEYRARLADYKSNPSDTTRADFVEAKQRLAWTLTSQAIQALVVTACRAAGYAIRGELKKHFVGDKEDKNPWVQLLQDGGSLISGNLWFGSQLFTCAMSALEMAGVGNGETLYDIEAPSLDMINNLMTDTLGLIKKVAKGDDFWSITKAANKALTDGIQMFSGMPAKNAEKYAKGIYNNAITIHNFFAKNDWTNMLEFLDDWSDNEKNIPLSKWGEYINYYNRMLKALESGAIKTQDGKKYKDPASEARKRANKAFGAK